MPNRDRYRIAVFILLVFLSTLSFGASGSTAATYEAQEMDTFYYFPVAMRDYKEGESKQGVFGKVFVQNKPASDVALSLNYNDGAGWSIVASTRTDALGRYLFNDANTLAPGQAYYVSFGQNETNPAYVFAWYGPPIDTYRRGENMNGGDFDIADVKLVSPQSGVTAALPATFKWQRRGLTGETYRLVIIDFQQGTFWRSFDLGDTDTYVLEDLSPGMAFGRQYGWYVEVYAEPDSFGESFAVHDIRFMQN